MPLVQKLTTLSQDKHRVLLITEILHLVCREIRKSLGRKALARFAQTCSRLREPALDALWYDLDSLIPLIQCMPRDLWKLTPRVSITVEEAVGMPVGMPVGFALF